MLKKFSLDLCSSADHNAKTLQDLENKLGPYRNQLQGLPLDLLLSRGPLYLLFSDDDGPERHSVLAAFSVAYRGDVALLTVHNGYTQSEAIEAICLEQFEDGKHKISIDAAVPQASPLVTPYGFKIRGVMPFEVLIEGRWLDRVILERLRPDLQPQAVPEAAQSETALPVEPPKKVPRYVPDDDVKETFTTGYGSQES